MLSSGAAAVLTGTVDIGLHWEYRTAALQETQGQ